MSVMLSPLLRAFARPLLEGQMGDLIGAQGAAAASMIGPAKDTGLEEGAIDDQLPTVLEQIEQAYLALGPSNSYFFSTDLLPL
jgi:hypothetical protein